jgi:hypothetical protein
VVLRPTVVCEPLSHAWPKPLVRDLLALGLQLLDHLGRLCRLATRSRGRNLGESRCEAGEDMPDIRGRVGSVLHQRQRHAFAVETKVPLTPTWVVNEWSSTLMFGSMLAVKDPEL